MNVPKKRGLVKRTPKKASVKKASPKSKKGKLGTETGKNRTTKKTVVKKVAKKTPKKTAVKRARPRTLKASAPRLKNKRTARSSPRRVRNISNRPDRVKIKVFGVGGGGGNAISRMKKGNKIKGIEFIAVNTDVQDLEKTEARKKIHIGRQITRGLGTGMNPDLGEQAAEESREELSQVIKGADLVFITAGMGGGTGSGASPLLAELAKEHGALTIAIVTKPFAFEGAPRSRVAEEALAKLKDKVDAIIVVPNDKVFEIIKKETPILKAFERIDDVLKDAIQGITELISSNGMINVDFSDIKTIMSDAGSALVGVGISKGQNRAAIAANHALNSPLLEFSADGARGILFGISGGRDLRMSEVNEIARHITSNTDPGAKIIFGTYQDRKIKKGSLKVTLIATGFEGQLQLDQIDEDSRFFGLGEREELIDLTSQAAQRQNLFQKKKTAEEEKEAIADEPVDNTKDFKSSKSSKNNLENENNKVVIEEDAKGSSPWDIPAFLRKKKKK